MYKMLVHLLHANSNVFLSPRKHLQLRGHPYLFDKQQFSAHQDKLNSFSSRIVNMWKKLCWRPPQFAPASCKLTFDFLILKVVSESGVMWPTSVPILVFLGFSVLDLGPMYTTDRETDKSDVRRASSLNAPYPRGGV